MEKNERSLQWVIAGIFFVVCFAFFQWIYPNHLFFKEQMRIFLYTIDYFISFWDEPAWLSCYVGNFLIQFFHLTVIGPLIVTCVLLLLWYFSMRVLRKFGGGNMVSIYALFPVALEWGLICRLSYSIASTLTLIFVLWLFLEYIRIKSERISVWVAFILLPIIYSMVGSRLFIFSLMVIFYEGAKNRKRWWFWFSLLLSSYLYPLFMRHFYGLSVEEAYKYSHEDGLSVYFPATVLILEIFALGINSIRRVRLNRHSLLITFLVVCGVFSFVIAGTNLRQERQLAVDQAVYRGDWERVLDLSAGFDSPDILISYYRNIAFSQKNELPQNLMDYYQRGSDALFLPIDLKSSILPVFFSNEVYYQLGDMDMARHRAIEGILFSPKQRSVRQIKRLAEIGMRRGDVEEARKYLNLLGATLFYQSWARSKEKLLKGEETLSMKKRLPRKSDWEREHDILLSISDYPGVLSNLVEEHPENKQALDYLLCHYLLDENLDGFKNAFDTYYKGKYESVPRLYEEALVQILSKSPEEEIAGYQIPQDVIEDYQNYLRRKSSRKAKEELRERYSSTYWYYSDYIK
ncbi:DUF6057 family protein [Parabacteroides sp. ZJ-118]|uniref:DUF6057 family protein n=1 Tax=Parabacteroides sp. ZJ-118 TaxID=2709398 RepID=UPI0013EC0D85|nr:DUF6057 family protein [Parabacteroides sp. ZJ-118]